MGQSGIPRRAIADGAITPKKLDAQTQDHWTYFMAVKNELPQAIKYNTPGVGPPVPATDTYGSILFKNGPVTVRYLDTSTEVGPKKGIDNTPLNMYEAAQTAVGFEYCWAAFPETVTGHDAGDPFIYTVGESRPLQIRFKGLIDTVAAASLRVGFRNGKATPGAYDDMTDAATLWAADGDITVSTILNNAATSDVDTLLNWADGEEHEFKVVLGVAPRTGAPAAGVARFFVDGVEVGAPFTFDDGDEIFPILWAADDGGGSQSQVTLSELEVSYLDDVDDHYVN